MTGKGLDYTWTDALNDVCDLFDELTPRDSYGHMVTMEGTALWRIMWRLEGIGRISVVSKGVGSVTCEWAAP